MDKAYYLAAKQILFWYCYSSFIGESVCDYFPLTIPASLWFVWYSLVRPKNDLSADNPAFDLSSHHVTSHGYLEFLKEGIVWFNGSSGQSWQ